MNTQPLKSGLNLPQHYLTMFGATLTVPFLVCPAMCVEESDPAKAYIIATMFFVSGIVTLLQSTFGVRSKAFFCKMIKNYETAESFLYEDGMYGHWLNGSNSLTNSHVVPIGDLFIQINCLDVQGDTSSKPPIDFKTKVPRWPGLSWSSQVKTELLL